MVQLDTETLLYQDDDANLVQDCVMALAIAVHSARSGNTGPLLLWGKESDQEDEEDWARRAWQDR